MHLRNTHKKETFKQARCRGGGGMCPPNNFLTSLNSVYVMYKNYHDKFFCEKIAPNMSLFVTRLLIQPNKFQDHHK